MLLIAVINKIYIILIGAISEGSSDQTCNIYWGLICTSFDPCYNFSNLLVQFFKFAGTATLQLFSQISHK